MKYFFMGVSNLTHTPTQTLVMMNRRGVHIHFTLLQMRECIFYVGCVTDIYAWTCDALRQVL